SRAWVSEPAGVAAYAGSARHAVARDACSGASEETHGISSAMLEVRHTVRQRPVPPLWPRRGPRSRRTAALDCRPIPAAEAALRDPLGHLHRLVYRPAGDFRGDGCPALQSPGLGVAEARL